MKTEQQSKSLLELRSRCSPEEREHRHICAACVGEGCDTCAGQGYEPKRLFPEPSRHPCKLCGKTFLAYSIHDPRIHDPQDSAPLHGIGYCVPAAPATQDEREARIAELEEALTMLCDYAYEMGFHEMGFDPVKEVIADLRSTASALDEANADSARLQTLADILSNSSGMKLFGDVVLRFDVMSPDGGSVGITIGDGATREASDTLDALRSVLDDAASRTSASEASASPKNALP